MQLLLPQQVALINPHLSLVGELHRKCAEKNARFAKQIEHPNFCVKKNISRTKKCHKNRKLKDGNFTSINVLSMFLSMNIYSKITRINTCTSSTLLEKFSPTGILTYYSLQGSDFFSLSRAQDMLITSFLISSPSLKFTISL